MILKACFCFFLQGTGVLGVEVQEQIVSLPAGTVQLRVCLQHPQDHSRCTLVVFFSVTSLFSASSVRASCHTGTWPQTGEAPHSLFAPAEPEHLRPVSERSKVTEPCGRVESFLFSTTSVLAG